MSECEAQKYVDSLKLEYEAEFVPFDRSRFKNEPQPCLNWKITISNGCDLIETDYMQGVGHIPGYNHFESRKLYYDRAVKDACQTGVFHIKGIKPRKKIPAPSLVDVLYSLVIDASVLDYARFEDWANNFGYDPDSREAERLYNLCLKNALELRQIINLEEAQEAFQDY